MKFFSDLNWLVSWEALGVSSGLYLAVIAALYFSARWRDAWSVRGAALVYNACQVALCGWMSWAFARAALSVGNPMGLNLAYSREIELAMLVHFLSKWLDYCDTVIMILKKNFRQLTFLHVYHHVSIALVWGYLLQSGDANGTAYFGAFLNSVVHFLMYLHYFVTSLGVRNPFKGLLTNIQLVQFVLCLGHAGAVVLHERVLPARLAYLQLAYHTVMLALFADFKKKQIQELKAEAAKKK